MNLTEEDKKRLAEEEEYREKVKEEEAYREHIRRNRNKVAWWKPSGVGGWLGLILLISIGLAVYMLNLRSKNESSEYSSTANTNKTSFNELARKRFDTILAASPELNEITCLDGNCTSVVYFDFKKIPDDLEFMIRANTVTFSNFAKENTGGSNVSIFATYKGKTILQCNGAKGQVKDCKK